MIPRAYVVTTSVIFGLVVTAHVARVWAEGTYMLREPSFLVTTALAVGMFVWSLVLLRANRGAK